MADFCKQCSIEIFGVDCEDLKEACGSDHKYYLETICEGCGNAIVDETGECYAKYCLKEHGDVE